MLVHEFHHKILTLFTVLYFVFAVHVVFLPDALRQRQGIPLRRRLGPLAGLVMLLLAALGANMPMAAQAAPGGAIGAVTETVTGWEGEMAPLPQYQAYCRTYGGRDPGCAVELGGTAPLVGPTRLTGKQKSLSMALHVHRQVVDDLIYREDAEDVWQILGSIGTGMEGDCDDVVMTTIARLVRRGYPRGALRATIVQLPADGGYHLILAIRLGNGEMYLDDRHRWPKSAADLQALGYRFVAQEVPGQVSWVRALPDFPAVPLTPAPQVADRNLSEQ